MSVGRQSDNKWLWAMHYI